MLCESGHCHGLPNQVRVRVRHIPAAESNDWCTLCVMTSEEPELYIEDLNLDKSFLFIVKPSTGLSQLCKTFDRFKPEELDFRLNAFLNRCIRKRWVHLVGEPDECNLSGDDLLKTMHGTITLV